MNKLVLMRHGQSQWNLENRFTGFEDVGLTEKGRMEAQKAGESLSKASILFDSVFTSTLSRAIETTEIALREAGQQGLLVDMVRHPDLRERDYGDLTGLNKAETADKFGKEQVHIWRRSYDVPPPGGECLQDVVEKRVRPYYEAQIRPLLIDKKTVLIGAHGNTLRAMLIILEAHTPETINSAEMPTGVPLVFEMDGDKPVDHYFLD